MSIRATRVVDLFLTYDCNCRCPYCFVADRGRAFAMSPSVLDRAIDWIVETAAAEVEVVFLGGEPTLKPELIERAVLRARRWQDLRPIRFSFSMTTNGLRIDESMARRLAAWQVPYLLSIDGVGNRHDRARPSPEHTSPFQAIVAKLPMLLAHQPYLGARVTPLPKAVPWLCEDLTALQRLGLQHFVVSPATGVRWSDAALDCFAEQLSAFAATRTPHRNGHAAPILGGIDDNNNFPGHWGCGAGQGRYSIDPSGQIFACARFNVPDADAELSLGDIYAGIDADGAVLRYTQAAQAPRPLCQQCAIRDRCLGGCPAVNLQETGNLVGPSPNECRFNKAMERVRANIASTLPVTQQAEKEVAHGQ